MSDPGIPYIAGQGGLVVGDTDLVHPGGGPYVPWTILDLSPLWDDPDMRGASTLYPGVPGQSPNIRRLDETTYRVPGFQCTGVLDPDGEPNANPAQGLKDNQAYLREHVVAVDLVSQLAVLTDPDGENTSQAEVQCQFVWGDLGAYDKSAVLFVKVHGGLFVPSGS